MALRVAGRGALTGRGRCDNLSALCADCGFFVCGCQAVHGGDLCGEGEEAGGGKWRGGARGEGGGAGEWGAEEVSGRGGGGVGGERRWWRRTA